MTVNVPDTRRLAPEADPATAPEVHLADAAGYKFLVTAWSIEAAGGPKCYIGHDMNVAHEHLSIDTAGFNAVYMEIESTLFYLGVPPLETKEFMDIIESFRSNVVAQRPQ